MGRGRKENGNIGGRKKKEERKFAVRGPETIGNGGKES